MDNTEHFTHGEEIMNAIIHGVGLGLSIAALVILVVLGSISGDPWRLVSFTIYGSTLVLLYLSSTLYHGFLQGKAKNLFEIFDHSAIYFLIAGTYTPITLISLRGPLGWTMFSVIWGIALLGVLFKAFFVKRFEIFSTLLYLAMGWFIIIAIKPLFINLSILSFVFLMIGGGFYTGGLIFYAWRRMKYHHGIWHICVLLGSVSHFFTILFLLPK